VSPLSADCVQTHDDIAITSVLVLQRH
jgi:hypothetical protein